MKPCFVIKGAFGHPASNSSIKTSNPKKRGEVPHPEITEKSLLQTRAMGSPLGERIIGR